MYYLPTGDSVKLTFKCYLWHRSQAMPGRKVKVEEYAGVGGSCGPAIMIFYPSLCSRGNSKFEEAKLPTESPLRGDFHPVD